MWARTRSLSDENEYRPPEEIAYWKRLCPIVLLERRPHAAGLLDDPKKRAIHEGIEAEIAEAFRSAKSGPFPSGPEWGAYNFSRRSPLADRVLIDEGNMEFDQDQTESLLGPH